MKKQIKKILLFIISIFTIPVIVNADMGAPESYQYEVIVTNPNGAAVYDWEGEKTGEVIPYDTKITVGYEHKINGELYVEAYTSFDEEDEDTIDGMIKFSDTKLFSTEINFSELYENEENRQYYALKDTELYKGPSTVYGKIEDVIIPAGTTIDYTYESPLELTQWIYTEYEGKKGWVYAFAMTDMSPYDIECTVAAKTNEKIMIIGDQDVYDLDGNIVGRVKDLEEYNTLYYLSTGPKSSALYIKGDNIEGWVYNTNIGPETGATAYYREDKYLSIDKEGLVLYEDYSLTKKVKNLTIPFGTEITTTYCVSTNKSEDEDEYEYVYGCQTTYKGKKYWVEEYEGLIYYHSDFVITTEEEYTMYKYNDNTESLNIIIPVGTTLETKWRDVETTTETDAPNAYWYYIEYENQKGWIYIDPENTNTKVDEEEVNPPEEIEEPEEETKEPTEPTKKELSPKHKAYIAIGVAVLLAFGALFTILLINKNKKNKKEEQKVEEVTEVTEEQKKEESKLEKEEPTKEEPKEDKE